MIEALHQYLYPESESPVLLVASALVNAGRDPNTPGVNGATLFCKAVDNRLFKVMEMLLSHNAEVPKYYLCSALVEATDPWKQPVASTLMELVMPKLQEVHIGEILSYL